jgi:hypothetical protein
MRAEAGSSAVGRPAELAVHPVEGSSAQNSAEEKQAGGAIYLMCEGLAATIASLNAKGRSPQRFRISVGARLQRREPSSLPAASVSSEDQVELADKVAKAVSRFVQSMVNCSERYQLYLEQGFDCVKRFKHFV